MIQKAFLQTFTSYDYIYIYVIVGFYVIFLLKGFITVKQ